MSCIIGMKWMYNNLDQEKRVRPELISEYLDNGWTLGMSESHKKNNRTEETEKRRTLARRETTEKNGYYHSSQSLIQQVQTRRNNGKPWVPEEQRLGMISRLTGTKIVYSPILNREKRIRPEFLPEYLDKGWVLGQSDEHTKKITEIQQSNEIKEKKAQTRRKTDEKNGYHHSSKTIEKIKFSQTGNVHSKESYIQSTNTRNQTIKNRGYLHTSEAKRKFARPGPSNANYGKIWLHKVIEGKRKCHMTAKEDIEKYLSEGWLIGMGFSPESQIKNILKAVCTRPNKFETRALGYLNQIYNNKFKYTGDGSFIVNHRSADAYSEKLKTVALFNGTYYHLKIDKLDVTEENKRMVEAREAPPFMLAGYKVIFIWEDEV